MRTISAALLIAAAAWACAPQRGGEHSHDGHDHSETLQLAQYSDVFEVFAEATPFVAGQTGDILAHFSFLKDFKPLTSGRITLSLIVGSAGVRQSVEQPGSPGIYAFALRPETAGKGRLVFDIACPDGNYQIIIPNIEVFSDEHTAHENAAALALSSSNGVTFTKEQSWKIDFATAVVKKQGFGQIIKTTAQIQPAPGDEIILTAKAQGTVRFSGSQMAEGRPVQAGQELFSIENGGMADNNLAVQYQEAEAEFHRAQAAYTRKQNLARDRIVSAAELQQAQAEFLQAQAVYENLRKNFSKDRQTLSAALSGFIKKVWVKNGEYTSAGQPVLTLAQNRSLWLSARLQPKYLPILSQITDANIRVLHSNQTYNLQELDGRLLSYGQSTEPDNPLIPVHFEIKNTKGFLPGSFVEMYIKTQTSTQALTVPNEALAEEMGNFFVFVQLTPELFEKRAVTLGVADGFSTEILEGIREGERVVTKGAIMVKLAQSAGALDAHSGHVH